MKNRKKFVAVMAGIMAAIMILSLLLSILPTRVSAASSSEIRRQINALKEEQQTLKDEMADLKAQYAANTDEIADLVAKKDLLDQEIGLLHQELNNINEQILAYNVLIADKQDELDRATARFRALNEDCKNRIRAMEEEGTISYWAVLFKANSFSDLLDRLNMVEEIAASDTRRLQDLSDAAEQVEQAQSELEAEKAELALVKQDLEAAQAELDAKKQESDELLIRLLEKGEELLQLQADLEQEEIDLLATIALKEQEYTEAKNAEWLAYMATYVPPTTEAPTISISNPDGTTTITTTPTTGESSVTVGSSWMVPCNYVEISSAFGFREAPTAGASTYHQGVDLRGAAGTPIYASRGGTVTSASYTSAAGYYVTINHGDGFSSIYMHMTSYAVSSGQKVSQGQLIGYMGKTGIATGNHLHFGILLNGSYVNPCSYVALY